MNVAGRKVAIDASMSIYQFLIAVRHDGGTSLTNDAGDTTRLFKSASFYFYARLSTHVTCVLGFRFYGMLLFYKLLYQHCIILVFQSFNGNVLSHTSTG